MGQLVDYRILNQVLVKSDSMPNNPSFSRGWGRKVASSGLPGQHREFKAILVNLARFGLKIKNKKGTEYSWGQLLNIGEVQDSITFKMGALSKLCLLS